MKINLFKKVTAYIIFFLTIMCHPLPTMAQGVPDFLLKIMLKSALPLLEKAFLAEAPVSPSSREIFPTVPSQEIKSFSPLANKNASTQILPNGVVALSPGDYIIPVMTYCMKSNASSPDKHRYKLAKLHGKLAHVIKLLNTRAAGVYSIGEIQHLSWNIQNGLRYEEMGENSQKIVDEILPEFKQQLSRSFVEDFENKWDQVASSFPGMPTFASATDSLLNDMGELGQNIRSAQRARNELRNFANDYDSLAASISLPGLSREVGDTSRTPWSRIQNNVYARFITDGNYGDIGQLQIKVLGQKNARDRREVSTHTLVDLAGLVADPGTGNIQPLSFSPLFGAAAIVAIPTSASPALIAAVVGLLLSASSANVDWAAVSDAIDKFQQDSHADVRKAIEDANRRLNERHDELEKHAREKGVLDGAVPSKAGNGTGPTRKYDKDGGQEAKDRDFEKIDGTAVEVKEGVWVKTLPDGTKVVSRNWSTEDGKPTFEIQPPEGKERIKIRYH